MAPPPVDLNRLAGILKKSQKVMVKAETGDYTTGNIDEGMITNAGEGLISEQEAYGMGIQPVSTPRSNNVQKQGPITNEAISNSNLPDFLKESFIKKPLLTNLSSDYSVPDDLKYEKPMPVPRANPVRKTIGGSFRSIDTPSNSINESQIRGVVRDEIRSVIKEEISGFMSEYFVKSLKEQTKKETIKQIQEKYKLIKK